MTTKRKPKHKPEVKKVVWNKISPYVKFEEEKETAFVPEDKGLVGSAEIIATEKYIENELKEMADRDIDTSGPTEISFTGDISGITKPTIGELAKLGDYPVWENMEVQIDDRDQLLRAVLNKAFPFGKFVFIDTNLLADECRKIGLKPGKDFARGVTVK